jgi:type I restriction enzyme S subunit
MIIRHPQTARIAPAKNVDRNWLFEVLQTRMVREQYEVRAVGTTFRTLNIWDLRRIAIPTISFEEQARTAHEFKDIHTRHMDLTSRLTQKITLLRERQQALITAAVTGQIDVTTARGVQV